mgnify:CR=1 FL=1
MNVVKNFRKKIKFLMLGLEHELCHQETTEAGSGVTEMAEGLEHLPYEERL